jgi:hypothetical protein
MLVLRVARHACFFFRQSGGDRAEGQRRNSGNQHICENRGGPRRAALVLQCYSITASQYYSVTVFFSTKQLLPLANQQCKARTHTLMAHHAVCSSRPTLSQQTIQLLEWSTHTREYQVHKHALCMYKHTRLPRISHFDEAAPPYTAEASLLGRVCFGYGCRWYVLLMCWCIPTKVGMTATSQLLDLLTRFTTLDQRIVCKLDKFAN